MRRAIYMILAGSCLVIQCSDDTENSPLNLEAHVKGHVSAIGEFGTSITERKDFQVAVVRGDEVVASAITDEEGKFELQTTTGTYTVIVTKSTYAIMAYPGIALLGGQNPFQLSATVLQRSTASFEQTSLTQLDLSTLTFHARIFNDPPPMTPPAYGRRVIIFMGTDANVSKDNYWQYASIYMTGTVSGSFIDAPFYFDRVKFPSGTTLYARAYGLNYVDGGFSDVMHDDLVFYSLSTHDSGVMSFQIP